MLHRRTFSYTLLANLVVLSLPFANATFIASNAGMCSSNEFWYEPIRDCIPLGKRSLQNAPPYGAACPSQGNWYWSSQLSLCLPSSPVSDPVSCPIHYTWDVATHRCTQDQRSTVCGDTEFWFSGKATCLPRRSSDLPSTRCPSGWYWSIKLLSCAPATPEALSSLTCGGDFVWSPSALICQRATSPSRRTPSSTHPRRSLPSPSPGQSSRRRNLKSRTVSLCPAKLDACPILRAGDLSDYECVDPTYDLQHCGGCSTDGRGQDCTSIKGVWIVECARARCSVLTCRAGYVPSIDRRSCIKL